MLTTALFVALIASVLVFGASVFLFHAPTLERRGVISYESLSSELEVHYGVAFKSPPRLDLRVNGSIDYTIVSQTASGFALRVGSRMGGSTITWVADGLPEERSDPRTGFKRLNVAGQLSLLAAGLSLIGLIADLLGIFQAVAGAK